MFGLDFICIYLNRYLFSDPVRRYCNQAFLDSAQTRDFGSLFCIRMYNLMGLFLLLKKGKSLFISKSNTKQSKKRIFQDL